MEKLNNKLKTCSSHGHDNLLWINSIESDRTAFAPVWHCLNVLFYLKSVFHQFFFRYTSVFWLKAFIRWCTVQYYTCTCMGMLILYTQKGGRIHMILSSLIMSGHKNIPEYVDIQWGGFTGYQPWSLFWVGKRSPRVLIHLHSPMFRRQESWLYTWLVTIIMSAWVWVPLLECSATGDSSVLQTQCRVFSW